MYANNRVLRPEAIWPHWYQYEDLLVSRKAYRNSIPWPPLWLFGGVVGPIGSALTRTSLTWYQQHASGFVPGPDGYEVMAFLSQAHTLPVGTRDIGAFFLPGQYRGIDLTKSPVGAQMEYAAPGAAGGANASPQHSFQFHHSAAMTSQFYMLLNQQLQLGRTRS